MGNERDWACDAAYNFFDHHWCLAKHYLMGKLLTVEAYRTASASNLTQSKLNVTSRPTNRAVYLLHLLVGCLKKP